MNNNVKTLKKLAPWPNSVELADLKDVTTQLQQAQMQDIVFYRLSGPEGHKALNERLSSSCPGVLVTYGFQPLEKIQVPHLHLDEIKAQELLKNLCNNFYPLQERNLTLVGVTGTNGKTSCVDLCAQIMSKIVSNVFSLGTLGLRKGNGEIVIEGKLTTPGYPELRKILYELPLKSTVFLEVSSHALDQKRIDGLLFRVGGWTNLGYDHLDYHKNLENYLQAKTKLFNFCKEGVLTLESQEVLNHKLTELGLSPQQIPLLDKQNIQHLNRIFQVDYNIENLSLAKALVEKVITQKIDIEKFESLELPPGRMSTIEYEKKLIVIDYAHTPDALDNVCRALKKSFPGKELWVVFGCGGDRDKTKRPLMREAVEKHTAHMIITSDNPRTEDPMKIIEDIVKGACTEVIVEADRLSAIKLGLISSPADAVVLIAGKGHEDYQEIKGQRLAFSDFDTVQEFLSGSLE